MRQEMTDCQHVSFPAVKGFEEMSYSVGQVYQIVTPAVILSYCVLETGGKPNYKAGECSFSIS